MQNEKFYMCMSNLGIFSWKQHLYILLSLWIPQLCCGAFREQEWPTQACRHQCSMSVTWITTTWQSSVPMLMNIPFHTCVNFPEVFCDFHALPVAPGTSTTKNGRCLPKRVTSTDQCIVMTIHTSQLFHQYHSMWYKFTIIRNSGKKCTLQVGLFTTGKLPLRSFLHHPNGDGTQLAFSLPMSSLTLLSGVWWLTIHVAWWLMWCDDSPIMWYDDLCRVMTHMTGFHLVYIPGWTSPLGIILQCFSSSEHWTASDQTSALYSLSSIPQLVLDVYYHSSLLYTFFWWKLWQSSRLVWYETT